MDAPILNLFGATAGPSLTLPHPVQQIRLTLKPADMDEPGWLSRLCQRQMAGRGDPALQVVTADGAAVAFVQSSASAVAVAAAEPVVAPEARVRDLFG